MCIRKRLGLFGLAMFGLPFAAAGVAALLMIPGALRDEKWADVTSASVAGGTAGFAGFGILGAVIIQWSWMAAMDRSRGAHPDKHWLWRPDWAAGRIKDLAHRKTRIMYFFAALWIVMFGPLLYVLPRTAAANGGYPLLILLILPLASVFWIYGAIKFSKRWREFGESTFQMATVPFCLGGKLAGDIQFGKPFQTEAKFHLKITCTRRFRTKDSTGKSYTEEEDVWSDKTTAQLDGRGMVPVVFQLPADALETDNQTSNNQITWELEVKASGKSTAYKASFEVPVFREHFPQQTAAHER